MTTLDSPAPSSDTAVLSSWAHAFQFLRYLFSGGLAFIADFGSYEILRRLIWYVPAAVLSGVIGFFAAFVLHKYIVFGKKEQTRAQFLRYCALQACNLVAQTALIYLFVEFLGPHIEFFGIHREDSAKILSIACSTLWNFFLYKFFVYA